MFWLLDLLRKWTQKLDDATEKRVNDRIKKSIKEQYGYYKEIS